MLNIGEGETIHFSFDIPEVFQRTEETVSLSGKVVDKKVKALWEIEDLEDNNNRQDG